MTRESIKSIIKERISFANEIVDDWYGEYDCNKEEKSRIFGIVLQKLLEPLDVGYESEESKKRRGVK